MAHTTNPQARNHNLLPDAATLGSLPPWQANAVSYLAKFRNPLTFNLYRGYLGQWIDWCWARDLNPLESVIRGHVELYIRELCETHKASTVNTMLQPVRGYYKYAMIDGLIERDPAYYADLPKIHRTKKPNRPLEDLRHFRRTAEGTSARHAVMVHMALGMGMRVGEICSITVEQALNVEEGIRVLRYIGKGDKPAVTAIPYQAVMYFDRAIAGRTTGPLLTRRDGVTGLSRCGANGLMETVSRRANLGYNINPHYARALGGSLLGDITAMQEFWRHEDPRTSQRYYNLNQTSPSAQPVHLVSAKLAG